MDTNSSNHTDIGQHFVDKLLPHVKSFSYTWFHLQAAKRKHFKNEDKRMNQDDENRLKQHLMNELPSVKIKWAVRLLMKLRKDIQKLNQKDLVDIISSNEESAKCVVSNPDMKGKMRRIDCLRQSDKVWRLDLVMVVLFKGIPLESSDGERLDKLPECKNPQLCVNPNHTLLNVRDLEIYLANFINTSSSDLNNKSIYCNQNILSPSVFSPQEFLTLSNVSIVDGASESEIKSSLTNTGSSNINSHYSDDNDDNHVDQHQIDDKNSLQNLISNTNNSLASQQQQQQQPNDSQTPKKAKKLKTCKLTKENDLSSNTTKPAKTNIKINELIEKMQHQQQTEENIVQCQKDPVDFEIRQSSETNHQKRPKNSTKSTTIKRRRSSQKTDEESNKKFNSFKPNSDLTDENAITDPTDAPSSSNTAGVVTQQLQAIEDHSSCSTSSQQDEEIKELLAKKNNEENCLKLKLKLVRNLVESPSVEFSNKVLTDELKELIQKEKQTTADLFMQLLKVQEDQQSVNQSDSSQFFNEINFLGHQNNQQFSKSTTPVFELLMSPLFSNLMPCGSNSSSSSSTSNQQQFSNTAARLLSKATPSPSPTNEPSRQTSFKKAKIERQTSKSSSAHNSRLVNNINSSLINALRFDSNSNGSFDDLINLTNQTLNDNFMFQQTNQNKLVSFSPKNRVLGRSVSTQGQGSSGAQTPRSEDDDCEDVKDVKESSSSPPPPPSIGSSVHLNSLNSNRTAPSPTKLAQFCPSSSSGTMHRPIPILQKADAALSSLISNLTTANDKLNPNKNESVNSNIIARSNSILNSNSPLMFSNGNLFSANSANLFSNYPNISPANGMNGSGSPTCNLFPSITSLFQSPIGTPRVTPTPQHFAAYLFNEDQFHSLIFPSSSMSNSNSNSGVNQTSEAFLDAVLSNTAGLSNSLSVYQSNGNTDLSPLFNNLINNNNNQSGQQAVDGKTNVLLSTNN